MDMRVWNVKGWFYNPDADIPSEHNLTVGAHSLDSAIDLAVEVWNEGRGTISKVERKQVYGVSQVLTMDIVESNKE